LYENIYLYKLFLINKNINLNIKILIIFIGVTGYYIKNEENGLVSIPSNLGILYYCNSDTSCNKVENENVFSGYYRNFDNRKSLPTSIPYIQCTKGSNICKAISPKVVDSNNCSEVGIGGIISIKESSTITYKICLNNLTNGIAVSISQPNKYFININEENPFGHSANHYVLIEIDSFGNILKNGNI